MSRAKEVIVIPCSGIGKALGRVSRTATYKVLEERPKNARTLCLALLTVGDDSAGRVVSHTPCIAIDGCPNRCSAKNILASNGRLLAEVMVSEVLRKNKGLKPQGIIELNDDGLKLADLVAKEVIERMDGVVE
ncbi:MAG: putative zinc-binding protein [Candidatus Bathyarchaeia archaeon]